MKRSVWWLAVVAIAACGDDDGPLVCPVGTEPRDGMCVALDGGRPDAGDEDGGLDADVPMDAPMGCVPMGGDDVPDPDFVDEDCDGFDGELTAAVAVTPEGVSGPPGVAATAPTIAQAVEVAETMGLSQVWVPAGDHSGAIELVGGVSIFGGYDPSSWSRTASATTRVVGEGPLLRGSSIDVATEIAALRFEAADAVMPGASSIAGVLQNVTSLHLQDVAIVAGRGADGESQDQPMQAAPGRPGLDGGLTGIGPSCGAAQQPRASGGVAGTSRCDCGDGGRGGASSTQERNRNGVSGEGYGPFGGACDFGSPAANNGPSAVVGAAGGDGRTGASGRPGTDGMGGMTLGVFSAAGYAPSDGSPGTNGREGQGGGGGGAALDVGCSGNDFCVFFGASGAGGGAGGCGGVGGDAGTGGGASVALLLVDSTVRLTRVELRATNGGAGGDGARGGLGGAGGDGGFGQRGMGTAFSCASQPIQPGGDGGAGGPGGQGGGGGGGGGGPSFGLVLVGDSAESTDSSSVFIDIGSGGLGGRGGGTANAGANGDAQPRFVIASEG